MKTVKEEIIGFVLKIEKSSKTFKLTLKNSTKLEEVSGIICKKLDLSKNQTRIRYTKFEFPHPI